jgi:putative tryptophan/tyrosine transport system substrate-binding protein
MRRREVRRREFVALFSAAAAAWPIAGHPQQPERMRRIGVLMHLQENDTEGQARITVFRDTLRALGWIEPRNITMEYRWTGGNPQRARVAAAEMADLAPEVILCHSGPMLSAMRDATRTIPIVFVQVVDAVGQGFVESLARPGGNITGFTHFEPEMGGKWLEILKEVAPQIRRVAMLYNPQSAAQGAGSGIYVRSFETVASALAVHSAALPVRDGAEMERSLAAFSAEPNGGLLVPPDIFNTTHREQIVSLAARHRLPAVYPYRYYVTGGGLISYGVELLELWRRAAEYVDRILKGARPGDLPITQPTRFQMIINLKTAKALGLTIPPTLLARADEVIE